MQIHAEVLFPGNIVYLPAVKVGLAIPEACKELRSEEGSMRLLGRTKYKPITKNCGKNEAVIQWSRKQILE